MQQTAVIKVQCRVENLNDTAHMLEWAVGHRVEIDDQSSSNAKTRCLLVFTDIAYYENDETILDRLGLNIIGKIKGVVSWEVVPRQEELERQEMLSQQRNLNIDLEDDLSERLRQLPIAISIMRRLTGKYAWKCMEAEGQADTFADALEAALTHFTRTYKYIRDELIG